MRVRCVKRFFQKISLNLGIFRVSFFVAFMVLLTAGRIGLLFLFLVSLDSGFVWLEWFVLVPSRGRSEDRREGRSADLPPLLPSKDSHHPTLLLGLQNMVLV